MDIAAALVFSLYYFLMILVAKLHGSSMSMLIAVSDFFCLRQ